MQETKISKETKEIESSKEIIKIEQEIKDLTSSNPEFLTKIINDLEEDPNPKIQIAIKKVFNQTKFHSGPLPDPETLKEYNKAHKEASKIIIEMAQKEQNFRHKSIFLGQTSAFLIGIGGLGVTAFLGYVGQPWLAGTIGFTALTSLVGAFLVKRKTQ